MLITSREIQKIIEIPKEKWESITEVGQAEVVGFFVIEDEIHVELCVTYKDKSGITVFDKLNMPVWKVIEVLPRY